jgi:micrococcal nuclease
MRRWRFLGLLAVLVVACDDGTEPAPTTGLLVANATVIYISDGDTIGVEIDGVEERLRLIGIDTPETKKPDTPVECFGPEATAFTTSLLPKGTSLHVQRDVEARDVYGRLLAYVYRSHDGLFVNLEIVAEGYARPLTIPPNVAHADEFVMAARQAEATNVGLWAGCSG